MAKVSGKSFINGTWSAQTDASTFCAFSPEGNCYLDSVFANATVADLRSAAAASQNAFFEYATSSSSLRAKFLRTIAEQILGLGDELLAITELETGLPAQRLIGERGRTINQLNAFADLLENPNRTVQIDEADAERLPLAKPRTELQQLPLGPVAVFGASNFPYAFSVAGGDTASALAAGCPVIVKGHPAHPATSELVTTAVEQAMKICEIDPGVFQLLQSNEPQLSHRLVKSDAIKAVGFTGSLQVAKILCESINQRSEPIPFYGELGSVNPQIIFPEKSNDLQLANNLVSSLMMGQGQFCTSPGVWVLPSSATDFISAAVSELKKQPSGALLTQGIKATYDSSCKRLSQEAGVIRLSQNSPLKPHHAQAMLAQTSVKNFVQNPKLREEIFGPCALIVTYESVGELDSLIEALEGQLTASIHAEELELEQYNILKQKLAFKVGRLIFGQMPTGVEICPSMNHGGPFPASTDVRSTSVGQSAIERFLRPICYQS